MKNSKIENRKQKPDHQNKGLEAKRMRDGIATREFRRMMKVFGMLQDKTYPNCTSIAEELVVSVKSAARAIDCLRDEFNLPIVYDEKRHGFYFAGEVRGMPWMPVTEAELFAVCISNKLLALYEGVPFQKLLALAFAKMERCLDDEEKYLLENLDLAFSFRPFAPEDPDVRLMELVTRAVARGQGLRFAYRKPGEKRTHVRRVLPYHVMQSEGRTYLLAYDPARNDVRTFALGRMSEAALTEERFERPKDFDPKKEFSASLGMMRGHGDYRVVVDMDAWLTDILGSRRLHPSQTVEQRPEGGSRLRLRLSCLEEIEQHVLSWGTHATVLEPLELRRRLLRTAEVLAERYTECRVRHAELGMGAGL